MCYVTSGGTPAIIFTILNLSKQHVITFLNYKSSWKMMTLLANLQMKIKLKIFLQAFQKKMQNKIAIFLKTLFSLGHSISLGKIIINSCFIPLFFSFSWYLRPSDTLLQIPLCNQVINIYFKPLQKTSFMAKYWHHFKNAWSKQVLWKLYSKPKTLQLTTIFSIIVIVFKLDPSSFTYPKNSFFEFYFSNNQV